MPIIPEEQQNKIVAMVVDRVLGRFQTVFDLAFNEALVFGLNYAYTELYKEAIGMYRAFITTYYSYVTKRYYRHGTGRGTGTGENLYNGEQIRLIKGDNPDLILEFNGSGMEGYKHDSPDTVLGIVMTGGRGIPGLKGFSTWSGSYSGQYFSVGDTTPRHAYELFEQYLTDMEKELCTPKLLAQFRVLWSKYWK